MTYRKEKSLKHRMTIAMESMLKSNQLSNICNQGKNKTKKKEKGSEGDVNSVASTSVASAMVVQDRPPMIPEQGFKIDVPKESSGNQLTRYIPFFQ